jgi:hypothetical protein
MEEWKSIDEEGLEYYRVSNYGNIKLLPREVKVHIVNHGRDMIVTAHRKGIDIRPSYEGGRPIVRMTKTDGTRRKFSLPLLILRTFKIDKCPGDIDKYTAAYLDGDFTNNRLDNLVWVSKAQLMSSISDTIRGESHNALVKYTNIIIRCNNQIVGYFKNTTEGEELFNSWGIKTSSSAICRTLKTGSQFYFMFDFSSVDDNEYNDVCMKYSQRDLKLIYDILLEDRRHSRRSSIKNFKPRKVRVKTIIKKEVVYKDRIVREKPEKQIVEKIVYVDKNTNKTVKKPRNTNNIKVQKLNDMDDSGFYKEMKLKEDAKRQAFKDTLMSMMKK